MAQIAVIGTGYVGLVSGAVLSDFGHEVLCVDADSTKIARLIQGEIPIFEPGLADVVARNVTAGRLAFSTDTSAAVRQCQVIFIAVGTPPAQDGSADLSAVLAVAREVAFSMDAYKVVVDKSTVPVGTAHKVASMVQQTLQERGLEIPFDVVSNPEFLREGSAVHDFTHPDRVVIGADSDRAFEVMREVYRVLFLGNTPFVETNPSTAELIKYAANAFLAVKISYMNEMANMCDLVGADVLTVAKAMGMDGRISPKFLHPGPGYGGSCFPKDTLAVAHTGQELGCPMTVIEAAIAANHLQKQRSAQKILETMGSVAGKTIGVLGLTFKPNTDDMREAPALTILEELVKAGAVCQVYDPQGEREGRWRLAHLGAGIVFCKDAYAVAKQAHALVLLTEWNQFRGLDLARLGQQMIEHDLFDFRNVFSRQLVEAHGFRYYGVGR